jgi:hypothetical protein
MATGGLKGENVAGKWNFDGSFSYLAITLDHRSSLAAISQQGALLC